MHLSIKQDMVMELADGHDQLLREINAGRAFQDFHEGLLLFQPSYKVSTFKVV